MCGFQSSLSLSFPLSTDTLVDYLPLHTLPYKRIVKVTYSVSQEFGLDRSLVARR